MWTFPASALGPGKGVCATSSRPRTCVLAHHGCASVAQVARAAQTTRFRRNAQVMLATQLADHTGGSSACPGGTVLTSRDRALRSGKRCDRRSPGLPQEGARRARDGARQASALSDPRTGAGLDATSSGRPCHATSRGGRPRHQDLGTYSAIVLPAALAQNPAAWPCRLPGMPGKGFMAGRGASADGSMSGRAPAPGSAKPRRRSSCPPRAPSGPGRP